MTGLDCLRDEMEKRGCSKAQVESKTAAIVLDILANMGHVNTDIVEAERKLADVKRQTEREIRYCEMRKFEIREKEREFNERVETEQKRLDDFMQKLSECETPEARDAIRRARLFIDCADVNSKYDNTAYIIGLGSILSNGNVDVIGEMQKINPAIFEAKPKRR